MAAQVADPRKTQSTRKRGKGNYLKEEEKQEIITTALTNPNLTQDQIGALTNVDRSTVSRLLADYRIVKDNVDFYKENRADIFAGIQQKILTGITDAELQKAPVQVKMMALGVIYDKERLERGQSTENIGLITKVIRELRDRDE
jgi:hypothetical protein